MAAIDSKALLSNDTALPSSATTEYSDYEIHLGAGKTALGATKANPDIGTGTPLFVNIAMTASASTGSSPTATFNVVHGASTGPTTVLLGTGAIAAATLVKGWKIALAIPNGCLDYLRLQVVAGTAGFSTGTYTAWVSPEPVATI